MTREPLSDAERLDWLRLIRTERIGPRTFFGLLARFGSAGEVLRALPDIARRSGRPALRVASLGEVEREWEAARRLGVRLVAHGETEYPRALAGIDTAPPLLAVQGEVALLARPAVAIVGSRNASAAGGAFAARLAAELGRDGYVVVSGLARGIDARAHAASIGTGTVAVLAGGHDRVYPAAHVDLLARILDAGGAAVSEMPLGWEPRGRDFPRRNRIVSGLCYGVVVVEAARRSGSLITARLALEQGREVFAVPGSPLDPRAEGTNDLIRSGATLVAAADHVAGVLAPLVAGGSVPTMPRGLADGEAEFGFSLWEELDGQAPGPDPSDVDGPDEPASDRDAVLARLGPSAVGVDELGRQTDLPIRIVQRLVVELELEGLVERGPDGGVSLRVPGR